MSVEPKKTGVRRDVPAKAVIVVGAPMERLAMETYLSHVVIPLAGINLFLS